LNALNGPKSLGNTLRLVRELKEELGSECAAADGRADGPLLAGNGSNTAFNDKIVEVLSSHEFKDLGSKLGLAVAESPHLSLQGAHLVVE
jgi:hypothetical protein